MLNLLSIEEKMHFSVLKKKIDDVSEKNVDLACRELEADGLVACKRYPVVLPIIEYSLTRHGKDFSSVLLALRSWDERLEVKNK